MVNFLLLMIIPILMSIGALLIFKKKITLGEFFGQIAVVAVLMAAGVGIAYWGSVEDTEVWNGQVIKKERLQVSCEHSYECNCYYTTDCSGSGKNRSCSETRHCSTCYEHDYDVDWRVYSSTKEDLNIDRVDRQGLTMPPRWGKAYLGEPYASQHTFTNYIKANPDSVLLGTKGDMKRFGSLVPKYPDSIYDYYYNNPVINMGVPNVDLTTWNWLVRESNKTLGTKKQVHIIVILVPTNDRSYIFALKDAWLGGKKNDVDVVIGSKDGNHIDFTEVLSWSKNKAMGVDLRNGIQDIGSLVERDKINSVISETVDKEFVRMHMKDMEWLARSFQPSGTAMTILFVLGLLANVGLIWWSIVNDIEEDSDGYYRRGY